MPLKSCPPCSGDCNQGRGCPARQPVARIILHPACTSSPDAIEAREQETGLVAVRQRGSKVVRMVPAFQLRIRQTGCATSVSVGPELPGVA